MDFKTEQEKFWAEDFGNSYIERNKGEECLASDLIFFSKTFNHIGKINSVIEFGANIGLNLKENASGFFISKNSIIWYRNKQTSIN